MTAGRVEGPTHAVSELVPSSPLQGSSVCSRIDAGSGSDRASARAAARTSPSRRRRPVRCPVTSPTDSRITPWGRTATSYQSPPTEAGLPGEGDLGEAPAVDLGEPLGLQRRLQRVGHPLLLLEPLRTGQGVGAEA